MFSLPRFTDTQPYLYCPMAYLHSHTYPTQTLEFHVILTLRCSTGDCKNFNQGFFISRCVSPGQYDNKSQLVCSIRTSHLSRCVGAGLAICVHLPSAGPTGVAGIEAGVAPGESGEAPGAEDDPQRGRRGPAPGPPSPPCKPVAQEPTLGFIVLN